MRRRWGPATAAIAGGLLLAAGWYRLMNSTSYQVAGKIVPRVATREKAVALTFDDGPNERTRELLELLQEKGVPATFYLIGERMERFPDETRQIVAAGHELGNHSYSHRRMVLKPPGFIAREIERTNGLIREASYQGDISFRPPYGKKLVALPLFLARQQITTVTWEVEPVKALGSGASSQAVTEYVMERTRPGSIILIHPWYGDSNSSREALGGIIDGLKAQGYELVTVSQLMAL